MKVKVYYTGTTEAEIEIPDSVLTNEIDDILSETQIPLKSMENTEWKIDRWTLDLGSNRITFNH